MFKFQKKCHLLLRETGVPRSTDGPIRYEIETDQFGFFSVFQPSENACLLRESQISGNVWSTAILDSVRSVCQSKDGRNFALVSKARCYVSEIGKEGTPNNFCLPQISQETGAQGSCVSFLPESSAKIVVSLSRDIRVFDLHQNLRKSGQCQAKSFSVISGAAAHAIPISFTFVTGSPQVIATGWDLGPSQYVRLMDLREGSSKSIKIWKCEDVGGLSSGLSDPNYLAGYSSSGVSLWDLRNVSSGSENLLVKRMSGKAQEIKGIQWSVSKRHTLAVQAGDQISIHRTDGERFSYAIRTPPNIGAFTFTPSNDLAVMDEITGSLALITTRKYPIPVLNPRTNYLESITSIGNLEQLSFSDGGLLNEISAIVSQLEQSHDLSLEEAVKRSGTQSLIENTQFAMSAEANYISLERPLHALFDEPEDDLEEHSVSQIPDLPLFTSGRRQTAISLLLSEKEKKVVLPLLRLDFESTLTAFATPDDELYEPDLFRSLAMSVVNKTSFVPLRCSSLPPSSILASTVEIVNCVIQCKNRSEAIHQIMSREDLCVFARAVAAICFVKDGLGEVLEKISDEKFSKLKCLIMTGISDEKIISDFVIREGSVLSVALVGLFLKPHAEFLVPSPFRKCIAFIRNQICNKQGKEMWRLRALIDKEDASSSTGAVRLKCMYCQKPCVSEDAGSTRCPNRGCHKPLPSCCVCLEPLTLGSGGALQEWTSWCNACKHGGHFSHLTEWFIDFEECPVAGCACQCASIDGV